MNFEKMPVVTAKLRVGLLVEMLTEVWTVTKGPDRRTARLALLVGALGLPAGKNHSNNSCVLNYLDRSANHAAPWASQGAASYYIFTFDLASRIIQVDGAVRNVSVAVNSPSKSNRILA